MKHNNKINFLSYFSEAGIFEYYKNALEKKFETTSFEMGVCGYPAIEQEYIKKGYPQVSMFATLNEMSTDKDGKIIKYDKVQTSKGQSGSPIILKFNDLY